MRIRVVEYAEQWSTALGAFNARLAAAGNSSFFPPPPGPRARPPSFHDGLKQVRYLAVEDGPATQSTGCPGAGRGPRVCGAYALKFQPFWLAGEVVDVANFALPVSEGVIDRSYTQVAVRLLLDAIQRQPLLYGLGMGGFDVAVARFLKAAGWQMFSVPFFFYVAHPFNFLRNIVHLRTGWLRRTMLDLLAFSGFGWVANAGWKLLHAKRPGGDGALRAERVADFQAWSDELWETARRHYGMCSLRDRATLRCTYPCGADDLQRIMVLRGENAIGWALLLNSQLHGHRHFGNMRLGSIVDCFAEPANAASVIEQARSVLVRQGVDLIVSNQSHSAWCAGLKACGFISGPSNFIFASSKALTRKIEEKQIRPRDVHLNRGDGDGPINL
jgi:hypothetical protein